MITDLSNIRLFETATIKDALQMLNINTYQIVLIVDSENKLLGTVTDGDIRRGLLNNISLDENIMRVIFKDPLVAKEGDSKECILNLIMPKQLHQVPIINNDNVVMGIYRIEDLIKPTIKTNKVILMVGGLGTRLRPLTETTPKPMLKVGNKPILQTILEKFVESGFVNIVMCVGYKSHIIQDYFGDGSRFGLNIEYVLEDKRMGTAGALSLIEEKLTEPFFVMNGDLLTNVNFDDLLNFHVESNAKATMCVREYDFKVPYGVVKLDDEGNMKSIEEKPVHKFFVSAGIYMLDPTCIESIPENRFYDMPTLFEDLIEKKEKCTSFPLVEYWLDIGRMEEYERANNEYSDFFDA